MQVPSKLKKFLKKAKSLKTREVLFSEGTYQIEVIDKKSSFQPFLQIDDKGDLLDCFCSCNEQEKRGFCSHITAAYLRVYDDGKEPLHLRFKRSFFKHLFEICAEHKSIKIVQNKMVFDKFLIVEIKRASLKKRIQEILKMDREKLEGSIKLSSMSFEDIHLIKKGEVPLNLAFELSVFSDIAKELFLLQDHHEVNFVPENELPKLVEINTKEIKLKATFEKKDWTDDLIRSLSTLKTSLLIIDLENIIESITYDPQKIQFEIHYDEDKMKIIHNINEAEKISLGNWFFIPNVGFLSLRIFHFFKRKIIPKEEILNILNDHKDLLSKYLKNVTIDLNPQQAKYHLFFDEKEDLHILPYLFDKDDIKKACSHFFLNWIFIENRGFFLFEDLSFGSLEKIISKQNITDFVTQNKNFLQNIKGFETHFGSFQEHLVFRLTKEQDLQFSIQIELPEGLAPSIDFGSWIYIKDRGFYSKKESGSYPIDPHTYVGRENISHFLNTHKEDLENISHFFMDRSPFEKYGLKIYLEENIKVGIEKVLRKNIKEEDLIFFENYIYVKNEGFYPLLYNHRIPEEFRKNKTISSTDEDFFLNYELHRLMPFVVFLDPRLKEPKEIKVILENLKRDKNTYLIELYYISDIGKMSAIDLHKELIKKKKYIFSPIGLLNSQNARLSWLKEISSKRILHKKNMIRLSFLQWLKLSVFEDLKKPSGDDKKSKKIAKIFDELSDLQTNLPLDLSLLQASLRPYQEKGVMWLWFLYNYGLSGLLCDEMGLGKTHQAMALLSAVQKYKNEKIKYLVVCPTSVIYHWEELLKKFLPTFKVLLFHGTQREIQEYDIMVTSYGVMRLEHAYLSSQTFEVIILDEIQIAKNFASKTNKALRKLKANMMIGLTGTPIENRIRELKALFDIILPSYLPKDAQFQSQFINPIEKENDKEKKELLINLIKPFILRRKKGEVLLDLPEKIEEISYCDLINDQKVLYETTSTLRKKFITDLRDAKISIDYTHIFALLLKLKQICDHPVLINKDFANYKKYKSGKFELFQELIFEALDSDQKVVIFSQYLDMLLIISKFLKEHKIDYAQITGATKNRKEEIKRFKEDPKCKIFLASLLAAGVGIDLSCASIVIHYDRWWNPAKENQATDRVHRIGQNRGVQVFKLVTKHTIEERIHQIIEKKKALIEETIGKDDSEQVKTLSRDELLYVLQEIQLEE